jgi:hypothetical protein
MAIGKRNQTPDGKVLVIRIKSKDENGVVMTPYQFEISEPPQTEGGEWTVRPKLEEQFGGDLYKVERTTKIWKEKNKEYDVIKLYFKDDEAKEVYLFDGRLSAVARNLYLALANLESYEGVSISLYKSENKTTNKVYTNVSVWQNDKMVKGKYPLDKLPKPEVTLNKKKEVIATDYTELDDLVKKEIDELAKKVEAAQKNVKKTAPKSAQAAAPQEPEPAPEINDQDVPFKGPR